MPFSGLSRSGSLYARIRSARAAVNRARYRTSKVHETAFLAPGGIIAPDLVADEHVFVGPNCTIEAGVRIGRWTMLAGSVAVVGADHRMDDIGVPMQFAGRDPLPATTIGEDCWIGHGAKVMVGVSIGDYLRRGRRQRGDQGCPGGNDRGGSAGKGHPVTFR